MTSLHEAPSPQEYFSSRFTDDPRRTVLWKALYRYYFARLIRTADTVLELGAGYCAFINNVSAKRRIAVDKWPGIMEYAGEGVDPRVSDVTKLSWLHDGEVDFVFASNLFEHLPQPDFATVLHSLRRIIKPGGKLCILQPNYRYCSSQYFDDYTHVSVYSHVSMSDFLKANGFDVVYRHPRFLPLTLKERWLPVWSPLIRLYLALPFRPFGAQMLFIATPHSDGPDDYTGGEEARARK